MIAMDSPSPVFDVVRSEKEKAVARFNRLRRAARLRQVFEAMAVLAVITYSSSSALKAAAAYCLKSSAYFLNHHVVFLIGNLIIVLLFVLCRRSDAPPPLSAADFYDDYLKHSEAAAVHHRDQFDRFVSCSGSGSDAGDEEKQIVVCPEMAETETETETPQYDDVSAAIEEAKRRIKRFKRTQSEKLRREIAARPVGELRRSETQRRRETPHAGRVNTSEIERLSSEEFRRTIDAFIDKHWSKKNGGFSA